MSDAQRRQRRRCGRRGDNALADFEIVQGGADDDVLAGGAGDEALFGNDGNDELAGGDGADDLSGGPGLDAAVYVARSAPVFVNLAEAENDGTAGEGDYVLEDVEKVIGGSGDDTLLGDGRVNVLREDSATTASPAPRGTTRLPARG